MDSPGIVKKRKIHEKVSKDKKLAKLLKRNPIIPKRQKAARDILFTPKDPQT